MTVVIIVRQGKKVVIFVKFSCLPSMSKWRRILENSGEYFSQDIQHFFLFTKFASTCGKSNAIFLLRLKNLCLLKVKFFMK